MTMFEYVAIKHGRMEKPVCKCDECGQMLKLAEIIMVSDDTGEFPVCQQCEKYFS